MAEVGAWLNAPLAVTRVQFIVAVVGGSFAWGVLAPLLRDVRAWRRTKRRATARKQEM